MKAGRIRTSESLANAALFQCAVLAYNILKWMALLTSGKVGGKEFSFLVNQSGRQAVWRQLSAHTEAAGEIPVPAAMAGMGTNVTGNPSVESVDRKQSWYEKEASGRVCPEVVFSTSIAAER